MNNGVYYGNGNILGDDRIEQILPGKTKLVDFIINQEQAKTLRLIFDMYLDGCGLAKIKDKLERRRCKTSQGGEKWFPTVISHVLKDAATITKVCNHQYGAWESAGESGHIHKCALCKGQEFQSHDWDKGTQSTDPEKPNTTITTYKCKICTAERVVENENQPEVPETTRPSQSEETDPDETRPKPSHPEEDDPKPTKPSKPSHSGSGSKPSSGGNGSSNKNQNSNNSNTTAKPKDYNQKQPTESAQKETQSTLRMIEATESVHADMTEQTRPMAIEVEEQATTASEAASAEAPAQKGKSLVPWLVGGTTLAVSIVAAAWLFVIRKKKF